MSADWIDHQGGSVRADGAKIGEFPIGGRYEWWGYPPGWRPRGEVDALGPFNSRQEAKVAMSSWLGATENEKAEGGSSARNAAALGGPHT